MMWERVRLILAWPFLVIGGAFFMLGSKIGGAGARFALSDTFEWLIEGHEHEKGCVEFVKGQRPYRAVPQTEGDRRAGAETYLEPEFAAVLATVELEAQHPEAAPF